MARLSEEERRRLRRAAEGGPPDAGHILPRPPEERRAPVEKFQVRIRACGHDGKPVPSPVGPFPSREAAQTWWELHGTRLVDPFDIAETTIEPMYLSWRP
jgi:hypothetical protein